MNAEAEEKERIRDLYNARRETQYRHGVYWTCNNRQADTHASGRWPSVKTYTIPREVMEQLRWEDALLPYKGRE
jgi:hypothetical protein